MDDTDAIRSRLGDAITEGCQADIEHYAAVVVALNQKIERWNATGRGHIELFPEVISARAQRRWDYNTRSRQIALELLDARAASCLPECGDGGQRASMGWVIYSLSRNDGLLDARLILRALRAIRDGAQHAGDLAWVDVARDDGARTLDLRRHGRRVLLSGLTVTLIEMARPAFDRISRARDRRVAGVWLYDRLDAALKLSQQNPPISRWSEYVNALRERLALEYGGLCAAVATDKLQPASVPSPRFKMLLDEKVSSTLSIPGPAEQSLALRMVWPTALREVAAILDQALRTDAAERSHSEALADNIRQLRAEAPVWEAKIIEWLGALASGAPPYSKPLRVKTLHDYWRELVPALIAVIPPHEGFDWREPVAIHERLLRAYSLVVRQRSDDRVVVSAIRSLARFLQFALKLSINPLKVGGSPDGADCFAYKTHTRHPQYVSEREFIEAREIIAAPKSFTDLGRQRAFQRWLALTLVYRCGLRAGEVARLCVDQIIGDETLAIEVADNKFGTIKTKNGTRTIPAGVFLDDRERRALLHWRKTRIDVTGTHDTPLIGKPGATNRPYTANGLFGPIRLTLRRVSGDPTIRLHALRHAFAMHLLNVLRSDRIAPRRIIWSPRHPWFEPARIATIQQALACHPNSPFALTTTSEVLGHASPDETVRSYLNTAEFWLADCADLECPWQLVAHVYQVGKTTATQLRHRPGALVRRPPSQAVRV
ncbi:hypothetical protein SADO_06277 [Salinisphaera dokdonensis CL-ES53]|uniref:Tyr recombinase domain-containing protein n=1 Tax=Salinisphaera dokdonensis CL-ES53 TaxID=1304272 RepID=A0ABV2B0E5_9GAMM